jgi:hypothetical protein
MRDAQRGNPAVSTKLKALSRSRGWIASSSRGAGFLAMTNWVALKSGQLREARATYKFASYGQT